MDVTSSGPGTPVRPKLLLPFRLTNRVGNSLRRCKLPVAELTEEAVMRTAVETAGRSDFGDPCYREGLQRLLESLEQDAHLHFLGRLIMQGAVELGLLKRLWLMDALKTSPEIFRQPLRPPLIVIGLPAHRHDVPAPDAGGRSGPSGGAHVGVDAAAAEPGCHVELERQPVVPSLRREAPDRSVALDRLARGS